MRRKIQQLKRLPARMAWSCGHYDGPITGVAILDNKYYWFHMLGGIEAVRRQRAYALFPLTEEEIATEIKRHALFRQHVGYHCDYDDQGNRLEGPYHHPNQETVSKCYRDMDAVRGYNAREAYESREPVGYFVRWPEKIILQRQRPATNVNWFDALLYQTLIKDKDSGDKS